MSPRAARGAAPPPPPPFCCFLLLPLLLLLLLLLLQLLLLLLSAAAAARCCCSLQLLSDVHGVQGGTGGEKVAGAGDAQVRKVRRLVFCGSRTCGSFTNRDFQGALNLNHGLRGGPAA